LIPYSKKPHKELKREEEIAKGSKRKRPLCAKLPKKAVKFNNALEEPLATSIGNLLAHMKAMGNAVGVSKDYLKRQYNARLIHAC
jgi:hypothetical protein